jgi:uncharacterized membrane protein (DUF4010 family)
MVDPLLATIVVGTLLIVALIALVTYRTWKRRREGRMSPANYRAFFIMGLAWLLVGSALMAVSLYAGMSILYALPLFALGVIYLVIGLLNRGKWGQ